MKTVEEIEHPSSIFTL